MERRTFGKFTTTGYQVDGLVALSRHTYLASPSELRRSRCQYVNLLTHPTPT
jgi:hypothetical protein